MLRFALCVHGSKNTRREHTLRTRSDACELSLLAGARKSVLSCTTVDKPLVRARCLRENSLSVYLHAHDTQTDLLLHALCLTAGVVKPVVGEVELALTQQR